MDCTKAFDTAKHSLLFQKLLDADVPPIFVRILVHMYRTQSADVRWKSKYSYQLTIRNGIRQEAVLSPLLFCFYMNDLFRLLRRLGAGCHIYDYYAGVFSYADDLLLLCPSRDGLQKMLTLAENYAREHNKNPERSQTKGIIFSRSPVENLSAPVFLNGSLLPWVQSGKYLGNRMTSFHDGYQKDRVEKRAQFVGRNIELNQEFSFAHPVIKSRINQIYSSSFYGSMLWNLKGEKTTKTY